MNARKLIALRPSELEALVDELIERGHVSDSDVTCRVCRALVALLQARGEGAE